MTDKKEIARLIMDAYEGEDTYNFPKDGVVASIRELVEQLQYYQCCEEAAVEDMVLDARAILDVCNELEAMS